MSILRTRSQTSIRCYLVRVVGEFNPTNWQDKPTRFTIIKRIADTKFLGKADAWKFRHNHAAIQNGTAGVWFVTMAR